MNEYLAHVERIYGLLRESIGSEKLEFLGHPKIKQPKTNTFPRTLIYESEVPIGGYLFTVVLSVEYGGHFGQGWVKHVSFDSRKA